MARQRNPSIIVPPTMNRYTDSHGLAGCRNGETSSSTGRLAIPLGTRRRRLKESVLFASPFSSLFLFATLIVGALLSHLPAGNCLEPVFTSSSSVPVDDSLAAASYSYHRPTPFAPDYRPECDIIFPASAKSHSESFHPPSSLSSSAPFTSSSYFTHLAPVSQGDSFLNDNDLSSFYSKSSVSSSHSANSYLSTFAPG